MKTLTLVGCLIIVGTSFGKGTENISPINVRVLAARMSIVHLKLDQEFIGATIEVYSESGELIITQVTTERKVIIDFYHHAAGLYKIKITKGDQEALLHYINSETHTDHIKPVVDSLPVITEPAK